MINLTTGDKGIDCLGYHMDDHHLVDPINAYDINMKIEMHAFETYTKYSAWHPEDKKIADIAQDEYEHSKELQKAMLMIA